MLVPGSIVKVKPWCVGEAHNNITLSTVQMWKVPNLDLAFEGESLRVGEKAIVIALLIQHEHKRENAPSDVYDWVLLLTDRGTLGWTQEFNGLSIQMFG